MKKYFAFLLVILSLQLSYSQQEIFVSGQVLDSVSEQGLESCAIGFFNSKNELVTGTISDHKGYFELAIRPGKYQMILDYVGYQKKKIPVVVRQNNQFLGTYKLSPDKNLLKSVEIKAKSKSYKVDKDVYVVTRKLKVAAANTDDVLDKLQGVSYDRYNDEIKVDGQSNIKILVDGLEKDEDYIRNLDPDRLKKIEIIRDPSGKFALDGYTAIVNVILRKNYKGIEVNLSQQDIFDSDVKDKSHSFPMINTSGGLTYTYNKINVYTKYRVFSNNFYFPSSTVYTYNNGKKIEKLPENNHSNYLKNGNRDRLTFGVDYYFNPRHTLSFETGFRSLIFDKNKFSADYVVNEYLNNNLQNTYNLQNLKNSNSNSNYESLFYIGKFNDNNELRMDMTFSHYDNKSQNKFLQNQSLYRTEQAKDAKNSVNFNTQYNFNLNDKSSLQFGYGFYHQKNTNYLQSVAGSQTNTNDFEWQDTRHKAFAYYGHSFNPKWSLKLGLAGELSLPNAFGHQAQYLIYQPYLDLKHQLSKNVELKLKYRTQSNYPGLSQANPNTIYIDNQNVSKGNPELTPQVTHKLALRANFFGGALFIEPYYHFSDNYIGKISRLRSDGIVEHTFENIGNYRHYGIDGNIAVPFSKKIFWKTNFDLYHSSLKYQKRTNAFNDYSLSSNLVYLNQPVGLTTGFIYQRGMNKYITAQGYHKWNNDYLGFLVQKSMMKKHLNVMLLYMLPVDFGISYVQEEYVKTSDYQSLTQNDIHLLKNVFVFRLNYRFSKGKVTRKTIKNINEDTPSNDNKGLF